jgi:hypothetical protein
MAMDFVDLPTQLRGKHDRTLRVRFTPTDVKHICRNLSRGESRINPSVLARLITGGDLDAFEQCLLLGLAHDEKNIHTVEIDNRLERAVGQGMQYNDLRLPLLRALEVCGLADIAVFREAIERVEAEDSQGNAGGSSGDTSSPMRSSSRPLSAVDSAS